MKLYHFCPEHLLERIKREGLTLGMIPVINNGEFVGFIKNRQWLTSNKSFVQDWETGSSLPYRRNAIRITIKIPKFNMLHLTRWILFDSFGKLEETSKILNSFGDPENWFIYNGKVLTSWFREITRINNG